MLFKIYHWYDHIKEPWRFLTAMLMMNPFFVLIGFENPKLKFIGFLYAGILALTRMYWVERSYYRGLISSFKKRKPS